MIISSVFLTDAIWLETKQPSVLFCASQQLDLLKPVSGAFPAVKRSTCYCSQTAIERKGLATSLFTQACWLSTSLHSCAVNSCFDQFTAKSLSLCHEKLYQPIAAYWVAIKRHSCNSQLRHWQPCRSLTCWKWATLSPKPEHHARRKRVPYHNSVKHAAVKSQSCNFHCWRALLI